MFTHFWDMSSGGDQKLEFSHCFIELPEEVACEVFEKIFGRNPHYVTCNCCGSDYDVSEFDNLEQATAYQRQCRFDDKLGKYVEEVDPNCHQEYIPLSEYVKMEDILVLYKTDLDLKLADE